MICSKLHRTCINSMCRPCIYLTLLTKTAASSRHAGQHAQCIHFDWVARTAMRPQQ
jgi:hypothetical protein